MLTRLILAPATLAVTLTAPAAGAEQIALPEGCTGTLTVQHRGCLVTHVWTCEADPAGHQWVALSDERGPVQLKRVDEEFQWLETYYFGPLQTRRMETPPPDPASLSELLETGADTYAFTVVPQDGTPLTYEGFDQITGETVIDGEPLQTTAFGFTVTGPDGEVIRSTEGRQFVSARHRLFFLGESWDPARPTQLDDATPVTFTYPGEEGFLAAEPAYGCDMMMSSLPQSPEIRP